MRKRIGVYGIYLRTCRHLHREWAGCKQYWHILNRNVRAMVFLANSNLSRTYGMDRLGLAKQSAIKSIKRREKMNAKKKHSTKIIGIILLFLGICVISFTAYHFFKNDAKSKLQTQKLQKKFPKRKSLLEIILMNC